MSVSSACIRSIYRLRIPRLRDRDKWLSAQATPEHGPIDRVLDRLPGK